MAQLVACKFSTVASWSAVLRCLAGDWREVLEEQVLSVSRRIDA
jgi:hypothetical protein